MKKKNLIILLASVFLLTIPLTVVLYNSVKVLEVLDFDMDVVVKDNVGFNLDSDALHFGGIRPGGRGVRGIFLSMFL